MFSNGHFGELDTRHIASLSIKNKIPLYVFFEITRQCNLNCRHCYVVRQKRKELSTEEIKTIIEQLQEENTLILNFSGGEVFTRRDFLEIARFAKKRKFAIKFFSNGTLIDENTADKIKELNPLRVEITIFSLKPKIHDFITGVSGSLKRSLKALNLLSKKRVPLRIKCTLMKQNFSGYQKIIKLAEDLGARYQFDPNIIPKINGSRLPLRLRIGRRELFELLREPKVTLNEDSILGEAIKNRDDIPCSAGHNSCSISAYGDVFPCIILPIRLGSLKKQRFSDIWRNSGELNKLRAIKVNDLKICSTCTSYTYCNRCPGLAYLEDKDILGPSDRACDIAEIQAQSAGLKMQ